MSGLTPQEMVKSLIDSGYTQNQIAEIAGVKQSSISRLLTGVHS
ncbi:helix-turn-helix domain-containing protein, partial [Escherichia coli]